MGYYLNFDKCEKRLKGLNSIDSNKSLYLLRIDSEQEGLKNPSFNYELFYINKTSNNLYALNLSECNGLKIDIIINNLNLTDIFDKYNSSSDYYNNICYITNFQYNIDIILKDR